MNSSTIRIIEAQPEMAGGMPIPPARKWQACRALSNPGALLERVLHLLIAASRHLAGRLRTQRDAKAMRLCETISLGEKRFLAIVQVDEERILIGGSASAVALLTRLPETKPFSAVLLERSKAMHSA